MPPLLFRATNAIYAGLAYADFSEISDLMRSIRGVLVGASIREVDTEGEWRVSMRSVELLRLLQNMRTFWRRGRS